MTTYKTRPFFLLGVSRALNTHYGVRNGLVYAERSKLGLDYGGPTVPSSKVTRKYHKGWLLGSVHFGEGSHEPVVWEHVLFPKRKLRRAERAMAAYRDEGAGRYQAQTVKGASKTKVAHFGEAWGDALPLSRPRRRFETLSGPCIDNGDGTVTHERSQLMCIRAPWGMEWDGSQFVGHPILANWTDATYLFGTGVNAMYPLEFEDLARVAESPSKRGSCRVRFAGFEDWRLITAAEFFQVFRPFERPSDEALQIAQFDPDRAQKVAKGIAEHRAHVWPALGQMSPTLQAIFPELANCSLRVWTADYAGLNECGWAYVGDSWESFCDVKAKTELMVLLVRNSSGREHEGRRVVDVSPESLAADGSDPSAGEG